MRVPAPPPPRHADHFQVTGAVSVYQGNFGPVTDFRHAWRRPTDPSEVFPARLFSEAPDAATRARQLATFQVVRAVSDAESSGYFEGGNAYDSQVVSFGLFHWTVVPEGTAAGSGELPAFLAYVRQRYPEA